MFAVVGNHVTALHRDRIGALDLPADLAPGDYRLLKPVDIDAIFASRRHVTSETRV
jgi:16S rRNA pseudouridine516 synthase